MLLQFAVMGAVYSERILGELNPRVGLLSIGEEDAKGNETTKETFKVLSNSNMNFVGNVESSDIFAGKVDVVVCDGFVGNVVLKTAESVAKMVSRWFKDQVTKNLVRKIASFCFLSGAFKEIRKQSDPAAYGGAPLLGTRGICIIGHGSSNAFAIENGIRVAMESVEQQINRHISEGVLQLQSIESIK